MGLWGSIKKVGSNLTKAVRGLGRIARGNFDEGLGDIGTAVSTAAPALHLIPGVGAPMALALSAAGGALKQGSEKGFNLKNVLGGGAKGAAASGTGQLGTAALSKLGGLSGLGKALGIGGSGSAGAAGTAEAAGGGGWLSKLGGLAKNVGGALFNFGSGTGGGQAGGGADVLTGLGKLLLGGTAAGLSVADSAKQREATQKFLQEIVNRQTDALDVAQQLYAAKAPLREAAYARLGGALNGADRDIFSGYLRRQLART